MRARTVPSTARQRAGAASRAARRQGIGAGASASGEGNAPASRSGVTEAEQARAQLGACTQIKLDFDGALPRALSFRLRLVTALHALPVVALRYDRTRRGWHVVVYTPRRMSVMRVVLVQALLGSDWKREAFNSARAFRMRDIPALWRGRWNVLFTRHQRNVTL